MGCDLGEVVGSGTQVFEFQSPRPLRGATAATISASTSSCNFNPRAPYGARRLQRPPANRFCNISILAPLTGRDDLTSGLDTQDYNYFNPRAPYGARLHPPGAGDPLALISILAPLTGRDSASLVTAARSERISILAPLTGRDCAAWWSHHPWN